MVPHGNCTPSGPSCESYLTPHGPVEPVSLLFCRLCKWPSLGHHVGHHTPAGATDSARVSRPHARPEALVFIKTMIHNYLSRRFSFFSPGCKRRGGLHGARRQHPSRTNRCCRVGSSCLDSPCDGSNSCAMKGTIFETEFVISTRASPDARRAPKEGSSASQFR